ncbi:sporulation protein [Streptomyces sp. 71268]|uniref:sporulation protein n=1 Tax=Streptomyces sp. 71268 TaxID=3002640 RepID=UPI0023FA4526|nr:sporulation protein [Streptomyces sp. 71268]WEV28768.1 sporulation protein [Streptomyces sp. 71268]
MVFTKVPAPLGRGGPSLDTTLMPRAALPGGGLTGQLRLLGGEADCDIDRLTLELVAQVGAAPGAGGPASEAVCARFTLPGSFRLDRREQRGLLFDVRLPWETPVTELSGASLDVTLGVRAELAAAGTRGRSDLVPLRVAPLPVQDCLLAALDRLGFGFRSAGLEHGLIHGTSQRLPLYQVIGLAPAPRYAAVMRELQVTFLANPGGVEVILEADKPGGLFAYGHGLLNRHLVSHGDADRRDWDATAEVWVRQMVASHGHHSVPAPPGPGATRRRARPGRQSAEPAPSTGHDPGPVPPADEGAGAPARGVPGGSRPPVGGPAGDVPYDGSSEERGAATTAPGEGAGKG